LKSIGMNIAMISRLLATDIAVRPITQKNYAW
jgi:hypothetical protein